MSEETKQIREVMAAAYVRGHFTEDVGSGLISALNALDRLEAREGEKTVPMAMIKRLGLIDHWDTEDLITICARYGYKVTE